MLRPAALAFSIAMVAVWSGCHGSPPRPWRSPAVAQPGPPAHAPAHGYRHKHRSGADLRFDAQLDVYLVVGHTGLYFHDGLFVRLRGEHWEVSASLAGPWKLRASDWVPAPLRAKYKLKKAKTQGRGAAKHSW